MLFISCFAGLLHLAILTASSDEADTFSPLHHLEYEAEEKTTRVESNSYSTDSVLNHSKPKPKCSGTNPRSLLFISTIDGKLSCLDASNGKQLWNIVSPEPLLSSSISYIKSLRDLADVRFIPSLDGNLYKWNGKNVEVVPLSADFLLGQMTQLPDGSLIVGGKNILISGVDLTTGKTYYECSATGCKAPKDQDENIEAKDVLLLRKTQKTVRAIERRNAQEKWNFSVGKYDLEFIEGNINEISSTSFCEGTPITPESLHFTIRDGVISCDSKHWSYKYDVPIAAAWKLEDNKLNPIDIFKYGLMEGFIDDQFDSTSLMYLGLHEGQMYIQQPPSKKTVHTFSLGITHQQSLSSWKPFIYTSSSRTPTLNHNKDLTALSSLDYPFDNGFMLISNKSSTDLVPVVEIAINQQLCDSDEKVCNSRPAPPQTNPDYLEMVPLNLHDWWKEVLALSVVIAIGINVVARYFKRKLPIDGKLLPASDEVSEAFEVVAEEEEPATIMDASSALVKRRSYTSSISIATDPITSSTNSFSSSPEYISRYLVDFEHLQCLGKGGFGVVFKAKKKIDDCEYAIKRIYLPRCDIAKEKMMREVKALAALEHVGIVRYFHAWWEAPPKGWQNETDKQILLKDRLDISTYELSNDWLLEIHSIFSDESAPIKDKVSLERKSRRRTTTTTKCSDDDPLGKRYNFDTGTSDLEEYVKEKIDLDLLNNDVFYSDSPDEGRASSLNEDSFEICFESSNNDISKSDNWQNKNVDKSHNDFDLQNDFSMDNSLKYDKQSKSKSFDLKEKSTDRASIEKNTSSKKRLVGKCCTSNSLCLTEPPLFLYIQMQLCQQATLREWLKQKKEEMPLVESMSVFMQIVDAVEYFHSRGMMHRDLKPANIFFSLDGSIKVGDFGLVTAITRPSKGKHKGKTFESENHTGQVGTQLYMSPEQASGGPYSQKVDIYALGLIFFELLCLFSTQMERIQTIYRLKHGVLPPRLVDTPQGLLVQLMTSENPTLRPEAKDIKSHEVMRKISV